METVTATDLKKRLGELLDKATTRKVAIERHGRVVAYLVPASDPESSRTTRSASSTPSLTRRAEDRLLELFASGDLRPSRWRRAGNAETMAGFAALLASADAGERDRLFALAERLHPGMSTLEGFRTWLSRADVEPGRLLSMLKVKREEKALRRR